MRTKGKSVIVIARKLGIAKSTVSVWVRDIILSIEQLETLRQHSLIGRERGRILGALAQKNKRIKLQKECNKEGIKNIGQLTKRELMLAGVSLYWAEGTKKSRQVRFCNSDPDLINFMIEWLRKYFNVDTKNLKLTVGLNEIHKPREKIVKEYWSRKIGIPLSQFRNSSFKRVTNKKVYDNYNDHYGTLNIDLLKPARIYYKIMGLIHGMGKAGSRRVSRDVS